MFQIFPTNITMRTKNILLLLCAFQAFLTFKPSEPYLSQYLICNKISNQQECSSSSSQTECNSYQQCVWTDTSSSSSSSSSSSDGSCTCNLVPCSGLTNDQCSMEHTFDANDEDENDYDYCEASDSGILDVLNIYANTHS